MSKEVASLFHKQEAYFVSVSFTLIASAMYGEADSSMPLCESSKVRKLELRCKAYPDAYNSDEKK